MNMSRFHSASSNNWTLNSSTNISFAPQKVTNVMLSKYSSMSIDPMQAYAHLISNSVDISGRAAITPLSDQTPGGANDSSSRKELSYTAKSAKSRSNKNDFRLVNSFLSTKAKTLIPKIEVKYDLNRTDSRNSPSFST
jgi:hypothetical protein